MASFRVPGVFGLMTNALPTDAGTLNRGGTPAPGILRRDADLTSLDDYDRTWRKGVGRDESGAILPLEALIQYYAIYLQLHKDAVSQFGAQSGGALRSEAVLRTLDELIAEARSPRGIAGNNLRNVLKELKAPSGRKDFEAASNAIRDLLLAEKQLDESSMGLRDSNGQTAMDLIGETLQEASRLRKAEVTEIIKAATLAGKMATEAQMVQLGKAVAEMLGVERSKQLLGVRDVDDGPGTMDVLAAATDFSFRHRKTMVKNTLATAKRTGNLVTDAQLSKVISDMLGENHGRALLGLEEDPADGPSSMELLSEALNFSHDRRKTALKNSIEKARRPGNPFNQDEIRKAMTDVVETEKQRQMMGLSDSGGSEPTTSKLLAQAQDILDGKGNAEIGQPNFPKRPPNSP